MRPDDWPPVEQIYREGIDAGNATFESDPPTWALASGGVRVTFVIPRFRRTARCGVLFGRGVLVDAHAASTVALLSVIVKP